MDEIISNVIRSTLLGAISLTDLGLIVVWTVILIIYIVGQSLRYPWKSDLLSRLLRTK
jgi:hypothetical protein